MTDHIRPAGPTSAEGGHPVGPPRRPSSTPAGFRNLRVLIPEDLHWRLRDFANQSRMTFQNYIVSWLGEAFPLNAAQKAPEPLGPRTEAHGHGPYGPTAGGPSPARCLEAARSPQAVPGSRLDHPGNTALVGSIPEGPLAPSLGGPDLNAAWARGHGDV